MLTRLTIYSLLLDCEFSFAYLGFRSGTFVLIATFPVHCLPSTKKSRFRVGTLVLIEQVIGH